MQEFIKEQKGKKLFGGIAIEKSDGWKINQKEKYDWAFKILEEIGKRVYRLRSLSDENTALCWLAQGGIEAYINLSNPPKWHDIAPGLLVAQEAEALITDSKGNSFSKNHFDGIVASSSKIHDQILDILK